MTRKYPTIKFFEENIENIKNAREDMRFLDFLRYKKMPPVGILNSEDVQRKQEEVVFFCRVILIVLGRTNMLFVLVVGCVTEMWWVSFGTFSLLFFYGQEERH